MTIALPPAHDALRDAIRNLVPSLAGGDKPFLTVGAQVPAMWAPEPVDPDSEDDPPPFNLLAAFNDIVNYIPEIDHVYWPSSHVFTDEYALVLSALKQGPPVVTPDNQAKIDKQLALADQIRKLRGTFWDAYLNSGAYPRTPFQEFLMSQPDAVVLSEKQAELDQITIALINTAGATGPIVGAYQAFHNLIDPRTTDSPIQPWRPQQNKINKMIEGWRKGVGIAHTQVKGISNSGRDYRSQFIEDSGRGGGFIGGLFGAHSSGDHTDTTVINTTSETISITLDVPAWAEVPVVMNTATATGSRWFHPEIILAMREQDFGVPFTGALAGDRPAFGPKGSLPWRISSVIVAFRPTVTIAMGASTYSEWDKNTSSGSGWSAGPFGIFGGHRSHSESHEKNVTKDDQALAVTIANTDDYPLILGMTMEVFDPTNPNNAS